MIGKNQRDLTTHFAHIYPDICVAQVRSFVAAMHIREEHA